MASGAAGIQRVHHIGKPVSKKHADNADSRERYWRTSDRPERKKRNQKSEYEQQKLPHVMLFSQPQSPEAVSVSTGSAGKR